MTTFSSDTYQAVRPAISTLPGNIQYTDAFDDWLVMHDTFNGERAVKSQTTTYLPKTQGMLTQANGAEHYNAYIARAVWFDYVAETVLGMYGLFWQKEPQVVVPQWLSPWMRSCSMDGDTFMEFYRKMVMSQIYKGRYGFLVDIGNPGDGGKPYPWLVPYHPENIVNWGEDLDKNGSKVLSFVLLDESYYCCNPSTLCYEHKLRWRLCGLHLKDAEGRWLDSPAYYTVASDTTKKDLSKVNFYHAFDPAAYASLDGGSADGVVVYPHYMGRKLDKIPFVFANVTDTSADVQKPPLLGLANKCLAIYRGDADYREALYKQAQATLFIAGIGGTKGEVAVGASSFISSPSPSARGMYLEPQGNGLGAMRQAEEDLKKTAVEMGISLLQKSSGDETGASVKQHITVRTATLKTLSKTAADAMAKGLSLVAEWVGEDASSANIMPSTDFSLSNENPDALLKVWQVAMAGGMSEQDYYQWLKQNDYTAFATFEEWYPIFDRLRKEAKEDAAKPETDVVDPADDVGEDAL